MPNKRIEEIKGKITYLNKKRNLDLDELELDKYYKKLRKKTKSKQDDTKQTENDETDNFSFNFLCNPIDNCYASLIRHLLVPNTLGPLISFLGGYILFTFSLPLGILLVIFAFLFMAFINCLEDRYLIFSKNSNDLKVNQTTLNSLNNELNIDQMWFTKEELLKLQFSLPWYLSEPEIESADWFNSIIETIWLQMHKQFNDWLDQNCGPERTLNSFLGNDLLNLKVVQSNLGSKSPYISGIRVVKCGVKKENAILELELTFDSNLNIQIEGNYLIKFGIEQFYFKSKLRMVAGPLFREMPAVGSITINLIEKPIIEWRFTGCLQILNLKVFKNSISYLIKHWIGQPLKSKLNIAKFIPLRELKLQEPIELIKFDLIEAINLPRSQMKICCCKTKKIDTYCLVVIDNDEKFTSVKQDADSLSEWNQTLMFFIFEEKKESQIQVYIYDEQADEDELIGCVELSAEFFKSNTSKYNGREFEIQLLDPETKCPLKFGQTKLVFRITWFKLTNELSKIQKSLELAKNLLPVATLSVLVDSASGLETVVHQVQTPELRILVRITVGNQVQVTEIKERTGYPVFEEVLNFMLFNPKLEDVFVEIVDMYWVMERRLLMFLGGKKTERNHNLVNLSHEGLVLGYTTIRTTDILNNYQMRKQGTFQLEGYSEEAFIRLLLTIRLTELSQQIYTNQSQPRVPFQEANLDQIKNEMLIGQSARLPRTKSIFDVLDTKKLSKTKVKSQ